MAIDTVFKIVTIKILTCCVPSTLSEMKERNSNYATYQQPARLLQPMTASIDDILNYLVKGIQGVGLPSYL